MFIERDTGWIEKQQGAGATLSVQRFRSHPTCFTSKLQQFVLVNPILFYYIDLFDSGLAIVYIEVNVLFMFRF